MSSGNQEDGEQVQERTVNTLTGGDSTGNEESNREFDVVTFL